MITAAIAGEKLARLRSGAAVQRIDASLCEDNETVMCWFLVGSNWVGLNVEGRAHDEPLSIATDVLRESERAAIRDKRKHLTLINGSPDLRLRECDHIPKGL